MHRPACLESVVGMSASIVGSGARYYRKTLSGRNHKGTFSGRDRVTNVVLNLARADERPEWRRLKFASSLQSSVDGDGPNASSA